MLGNGIAKCLIPKGRYSNPDRAEDLAFKVEQIQEMTRFFQRQASRWSFQEDGLDQYYR
jgi:hypothetical protein